ncbi:hypothetical protein H0H92_015953 [Tricholoma furcatifolium]|nr:hypothetical protein H0H92_015953 [Tricholoma furcatifolium]
MSAPSLSRTSSTASVDSSDDAASSAATSSRRTRKRFTNDQLTILENLFHKTSHPSREERETVASLGRMYVLPYFPHAYAPTLTPHGRETKSVTIWFQNKRQMERKVALNTSTHASRPHTHSLLSTTSRASRPSLDSIASRSELPMPPPRTPTRPRNPGPGAAIWDHMPSSPVCAPFSPPQRQYVDFTVSQRSRRTLEWACAAARLGLADRHAHAASSQSQSRSRKNSVKSRSREERRSRELDLNLTDEEDTDEAVTPPGTLAGGDVRWTAEPEGGLTTVRPGRGGEDDDMMKAALMLCDLGRRPSQ